MSLPCLSAAAAAHVGRPRQAGHVRRGRPRAAPVRAVRAGQRQARPGLALRPSKTLRLASPPGTRPLAPPDTAGTVRAGWRWFRTTGQFVNGREPRRDQLGVVRRRPGTSPRSPYRTGPARSSRPDAAVTGTGGRPELDRAAGGERPSVRHQAARRTAPMGGSNRLLSVEELAAYFGVPKKTVYSCWRQWGLRGYRVGRYLRFRERHVEEWLQTREV
jgi:excisionase family DNA binding protein